MAGSLSLHAACAAVLVAGGALAPSVTPGARAPIKVTLVHVASPEAGLEQPVSMPIEVEPSDFTSEVVHDSSTASSEARPEAEPEEVVEPVAAHSHSVTHAESALIALAEQSQAAVGPIDSHLPCVIGFEGPILNALMNYRADINASSIASSGDAGRWSEAANSDRREPVMAPAPPPPAAPPSAAPQPPSTPGSSDVVIVRNPKPEYPRQARERGWAGTVVLRVAVRDDGSVALVSVVESSGRALLDRAAVSAVRDWTFAPATRLGQAVEGMIDVPVVFRLED
jgi:TonB family protein